MKFIKGLIVLFFLMGVFVFPRGVLAQTSKTTGCDNLGNDCCFDIAQMKTWCNNSLVCSNNKCVDKADAIQCDGGNGINTAIGCIPIENSNALIGWILRWAIGIGGGIAFLLIIVAGFQIMTSRGDPNRLKAGQELMTSAIAGLLLLIFSVVILRIIGFDILNITILGPVNR